jgi:hypothetical protein
MIKDQQNSKDATRLPIRQCQERDNTEDKELPHDAKEQGNVYPTCDKASPVPGCLYDTWFPPTAPRALPSYMQRYIHKCMVFPVPAP